MDEDTILAILDETDSEINEKAQPKEAVKLELESLTIPEDFEGPKPDATDPFHRLIIHIDMDAYYAQVEMKAHGIPTSQPMAVAQWQGIIALNYAAKDRGIKRSMRVWDCLSICPEIKFVHVATIANRNGSDQIIPSSVLRVT